MLMPMQPSPRADTSKPLLPSFRFCMSFSCAVPSLSAQRSAGATRRSDAGSFLTPAYAETAAHIQPRRGCQLGDQVRQTVQGHLMPSERFTFLGDLVID